MSDTKSFDPEAWHVLIHYTRHIFYQAIPAANHKEISVARIQVTDVSSMSTSKTSDSSNLREPRIWQIYHTFNMGASGKQK